MTETVDQPTEQTYRARAGALGAMLTAAPYRHNQKVWGGAKPKNECGTSACVAGWSLLARRGIVTIAEDGVMTWDPAAMEDLYGRDEHNPEDGHGSFDTLWRDGFADYARVEGMDWLGLSYDASYTLFVRTLEVERSDEVAREMLRRIADGRLGAVDGDGRIHFWLRLSELYRIVRELPQD